MISTPDLAGLLMWVGVLPAAYFISKTWNQQDKPAILWFQVTMFAEAAWAFAFGLLTILDSPALTLLIARIDVFIVSLAAVGWFLMSIEYTTKQTVSFRALALTLALPVLSQFVLWTNPAHHLAFAEGTTVAQNGALHLEAGPWLILDTIYGSALVVMALGVLTADLVRSDFEGVRWRQTMYLLLATIILIVTGLLYTAGLTPAYINAGPLGFILAGALLYRAFTRYNLIQLAPAARDETIENVHDAVLMLNKDDEIADANGAARDLFELPADYLGLAYSTILDEHPGLEAVESDSEHTVTLETHGTDRHFRVVASAVEYGRDMRGRVIALSEISALKERELELSLLKQINSRVFRHNFRNKLTVIHGRSKKLADMLDDDRAAHAETVVDSSNALLSHSETAMALNEVIEAEDTTKTMYLAEIVKQGVSRINGDECTVNTEIPDDLVVEAHPGLVKAVTEAVENALEHNDEPVHISIYTRMHEDTVTIFIEDDGSGIPDNEVEVLQSGKETSKKHGAGVGLWLIRWVAEKSNGEITIEMANGTRLGIILPKAAATPN